jgi:hypothetical protein
MKKGFLKGKHVTILGLGPSVDAYTNHVKKLGGASAYCDEVWAVNALGNVFQCDRVFHMDDIRVQEARAADRPHSNVAAMVEWLKVHPGPVVTSFADPRFPGLVAFPLADVVRDTGHFYFNSTVAYAMALAVWGQAQQVSLFGCDYTYANSHLAERGRACLEYWIALGKAQGMHIALPDHTSLLDACEGLQGVFYGYDGFTVSVGRDDDGYSVGLDPCALPIAKEVEARYDHSKHPNSLA